MVAHILTGNGCNASEDGTGRGTPIVTQPTRGGQIPAVLTYDARGNGDGAVVNTLAGDHQNRVTDYTALALAFHQTQDPITEAELSPALGTTSAGMGALVLRNREGKPGGGKGPLLSEEKSLTRASANDQVLFTQTRRDVGNGAVQSGIPRRLMPIECERLMGWPDHHTAHGVAEDGTRYALSDTARYRLCGNGVASPVAGWIAWRLRWALENAATGRPGRAPR